MKLSVIAPTAAAAVAVIFALVFKDVWYVNPYMVS
jgi:hypothetical protein